MNTGEKKTVSGWTLLLLLVLHICVLLIAARYIWASLYHSDVLGSKRNVLSENVYHPYNQSYRLYLLEDGQYVPFLLVGMYNDEVLAIREHVYPVTMEYSAYSGYYNGGTMDDWLNEVYIEKLGALEKESIIETELEIATYAGISEGLEKTETVLRNVFVLSGTELGFIQESMFEEGETVDFFTERDTQAIAQTNERESVPYWTRSAVKNKDGYAYVVTENGLAEEKITRSNIYVRPALRLNKHSIVSMIKDESGRSVLVLVGDT